MAAVSGATLTTSDGIFNKLEKIKSGKLLPQEKTENNSAERRGTSNLAGSDAQMKMKQLIKTRMPNEKYFQKTIKKTQLHKLF